METLTPFTLASIILDPRSSAVTRLCVDDVADYLADGMQFSARSMARCARDCYKMDVALAEVRS